MYEEFESWTNHFSAQLVANGKLNNVNYENCESINKGHRGFIQHLSFCDIKKMHSRHAAVDLFGILVLRIVLRDNERTPQVQIQ